MAGQVYVAGRKVDKAGAPVEETAEIEVRGKTLAYVSRAALKLEEGHAGISHRFKGRRLRRYRSLYRRLYRLHAAKRRKEGLRRGRGYGQLAWSLRSDERASSVWSGPTPAT